MIRRAELLPTKLTILYALLPLLLGAHSDGPDPRKTGAPGDSTCAEAECHVGPLNPNKGPGSVQIILPGAASYTPGQKQHIMVRVADPQQRRWGFQLTARLSTDPVNGQAGTLASTDDFTQVICNDGGAPPCRASQAVQFIEHTNLGTRKGATGGATFEFDWTPPATNLGDVILYAAGNASNASDDELGDRIYTTKVRLLAPCVSGSAPTINTSNGVVNGASFAPGIAPNSWITIRGTNLASFTRQWGDDEVASGKLPTLLSCTSVMVNNKPAYVNYISPTQINAVAPDDGSTGAVQVTVTTSGQTSNAAPATMQTFAPAFFLFDGKYLAATHANNRPLGKPGLFSAAPNLTTPGTKGELVIFYGTGFGPTNPAIAPGQVTDKLAPLSTPFTITIGGIEASTAVSGGFAGLVPPFADLYQFNVQIPPNVASGDQPVVVQIGGLSSPAPADKSCCFITVQ